jgi:hypothetical protein
VRFSVSVLLLALVACAPAANRLDTTNLRTANVVSEFKPDKGEGAKYKIGEQVRFELTLARNGFVTLITTDSDGATYDLERSVASSAGKLRLPRADDRSATGGQAAYIVDIPTGPQRVFLIYTDRQAPPNTRVSGKFAAADLPRVLRSYINTTGATVYDVAETEFEVVR